VLLGLRVVFAGLAFLGFWLGAVGIVLTVLPLTSWRYRRAPRAARAAACQRWLQLTFTFLHDYMRWFGLIHFDPRTVKKSVPNAGFVLVANHPTLVDVTALASVFGQMTCVAKAPLFRSPVIGQILRACAYVNGGDGDPFAGAHVITEGVARMQEGMPLLIFPEGTRSPTDGLHSFKQGAFEIACRGAVPIVPVVLRCTPPALERGRPWYDIPRRKANFTMHVLPVLRPADFGSDAAVMTDACEALFRRELGLGEAAKRAGRPKATVRA
jgi:1-acyl-sn-glycerol-3-phosphate acyltransferase